VAITANNLYVASYQTSVGHFSLDQGYFTTFGVDNAPLHASADTSGLRERLYAFSNSPLPDEQLERVELLGGRRFQLHGRDSFWFNITTTSLPNGMQGTAYQQNLAATGGTTPYHWSLFSGALPAGLTLSSGGSISGMPTAAGTSNFTAQVTDSSGPQQTATQPLSITINASGGGAPNAQLSGNYAFGFSGMTGNNNGSSAFAAVGRFTADGAGNLTNGEWDANSVNGGANAQAFSGTYSIGTDNRGTMSWNLPSGTRTFTFAMLANGNAQFIEFDATGGAGNDRFRNDGKS